MNGLVERNSQSKHFMEIIKKKTGYTFEPRHKIAYSSLDFYQNEGYTIIEFEDIEFKE